jgi:hypothetical protein
MKIILLLNHTNDCYYHLIVYCLFLIAPSVFSNVYFLLPHSKALKTYHCHFISFQFLEKLEIFVYIDLIYNTLLYITS